MSRLKVLLLSRTRKTIAANQNRFVWEEGIHIPGLSTSGAFSVYLSRSELPSREPRKIYPSQTVQI